MEKALGGKKVAEKEKQKLIKEKHKSDFAGKYVLLSDEWDKLHPAMVEFLTDLVYQGAPYAGERVARINAALKKGLKGENSVLEQFKEVRKLFDAEEKDAVPYMQSLEKKPLGKNGDKVADFMGTGTDLTIPGGAYRRLSIRKAYLDEVIAALEEDRTVEVTGLQNTQKRAATAPATAK